MPVPPSPCTDAELERISSIYWALAGEQRAPGALITYRLIECGTGREIHTLTVETVASLLQEGWIELSGEGNVRRWGYRITLAGIWEQGKGWK